MSIYFFKTPKKIVYGLGSVKAVGEETAQYGKRAFIVTGKNSTKKSGALDKVIESLKKSNIETFIFDQVESDPSVDTVERGVKEAKDKEIDVIVALGGGSPLDAAKAIGMMITNSGSVTDYEKKVPEIESIPIIAIPTTAGTGSEVTRFSVITDTERKIKMLIGGDAIIPKVAILDAELTITMPPEITAATGMDALTHAIEAYISKAAQPLSTSQALLAIKNISSNLIKAISNGDDIEAREKMMLGQMQAGLAFSNASVALVHAMSRPLGAFFQVPHGMANAILLPKVMEYNRVAVPEKFKDIAEAMGENISDLSIREASKLAVKAIKDLYDETGLPKTLKEVGVTKESIEELAKDAYKSGSTSLNPRKATIEDIISIYKQIC